MPEKPAKPARVRSDPGLVGARLRAARDYRGWSQLEYAARVGIYPTLLSKIENNHRTKRDVWTAMLRRFLRALNPPGSPDRITSDYLLDLDDKMIRRR